MLDWGDIRVFLAIVDAGSTLAAGRRLRVSQTTAARRVTALEAQLRLTLFERRSSGFTLTADGEALVEQARAVAAAVQGFERAADARSRAIGGTVRITATELYALALLPDIVRSLRESHPEIFVELDLTDAVRDLDAGEADISLRVASVPEGTGLVGRRLSDDNWSLYCSRAYAAAHGRPSTRRELIGHPMIGGGEPGVWRFYQQWLEENGFGQAIVAHYGTSGGLVSAVRSGVGLAALPCLVADRDPDLVRCLRPMASGNRGIWLLTHERLRALPRVRLVLDAIAEGFRRLDTPSETE